MAKTSIDLSGRVALITGASRGIGAATAQAFAAAGAHVVLVARTQGGLEEVDDSIRSKGGQATLMPLDLLDFSKIDALGPALAERFGRLDILVGNAAMLGTLTPVGHADAKEWERVINLNLNANFRLIRTCDPLLRASDAGRVIMVTSGAAEGVAYWGAYSASKAGLEALARTYAEETARTSIKVNILDPGEVATAMRAKAFPGEDPRTLTTPDKIVGTFLKLAAPNCRSHGTRVDAPNPL